MIQKVLKKILLWLFDSGSNNEVFAKAINDIENEIIQKHKVMKANELEKIYLSPITLEELKNVITRPTDSRDIEYIKTDAFIDKAVKWLEEHKEAIAVLGFIPDYYIEDFKKYIGE